MRICNPRGFLIDFPHLKKFTVTSPDTWRYNCIAWAMGDTDRWWWPSDPDAHWPNGCPCEETISAFMSAFAMLGYKPCGHGRRESGHEKIVLYAKRDIPTHAARQLKNGRWSSKLGMNVDIEHKVKELEGPHYGKIAMYFRRPRQRRIATIKRIQPLNSC